MDILKHNESRVLLAGELLGELKAMQPYDDIQLTHDGDCYRFTHKEEYSSYSCKFEDVEDLLEFLNNALMYYQW